MHQSSNPRRASNFLNMVIHIIWDVYSWNQKIPEYMNSSLWYPELQIQCITWTRVACLGVRTCQGYQVMSSWATKKVQRVPFRFFSYIPSTPSVCYYWDGSNTQETHYVETGKPKLILKPCLSIYIVVYLSIWQT